MPKIDIQEAKGLLTNADREDIPKEFFTVLRNLRPYNGRLIKTFGIGPKLTSVLGPDPENMITFLHKEWTDGRLLIAICVDSSTKVITVYANTMQAINTAWVNITTLVENTPDTFYHRSDYNPMIISDGILRMLPGNVGLPDGTNEGKGIWLGYIDRDFFDGEYLAATYGAGFYEYSSIVEKPDIDAIAFEIGKLQGGEFSQFGTGNIPSGEILPEVVYHVYGYTSVTYSGDTINPGDNFVGVAGETTYTVVGTGTVVGMEIEEKYYKFSYIYDGTQESLLSESLRINFNKTAGMFLRLEYSFTAANHNKRITAMKVYRSDRPKGPYTHIQTIDYLRESGETLFNGAGAYTGINAIYIPELESYSWQNGHQYTIKLAYGLSGITFTWNTGDSKVFFLSAGPTLHTYDYWDFHWSLVDDTSGLDADKESGAYGAFSGPNTVILDQDTGEHDCAGGILELLGTTAEDFDGTTAAATHGGGSQTKFKTDNNHFLEVGDVVVIKNFVVNKDYNGTFVVVERPAIDEFVVDVTFGSNETGVGKWGNIGFERIVLDNYKRAIHVEKLYSAINTGTVGGGLPYTLMYPEKGLYYLDESSGEISYNLYDTNLIEGAEHPLADEVSIKVNGEFAKIISGRLWRGNIVLDPGGKNEAHEDWTSYSEPNQYDVNPVSNIISFSDKAGGPIMGIAEIYGNPVILMKQAIIMIDIKSHPNEPSKWKIIESVHNIGNIAKRGYLEVLQSLYICYYDGIYRLQPNNLAESDATPTELLKISEPINDIYMGLTLEKKENIRLIYDQSKSEIIIATESFVGGGFSSAFGGGFSKAAVIEHFMELTGV